MDDEQLAPPWRSRKDWNSGSGIAKALRRFGVAVDEVRVAVYRVRPPTVAEQHNRLALEYRDRRQGFDIVIRLRGKIAILEHEMHKLNVALAAYRKED